MASIKFKLQKSRIPENQGVLHLQIIHKRVTKKITTGLKLFSYEWDEKNQQVIIRSKDPDRQTYLTELKALLKNIHSKLSKSFGMSPFQKDTDIEDVLSDYFRKTGKERMFFVFAQSKIDELKSAGNKGAAEKNASALRMYSRYRDGKDIAPENINSYEMMRFEGYLTKRGMVPNSVSYYMRILRAIYNKAVNEGYCDQIFPFRNVYTGIAKTKKRAIAGDLVKNLKNQPLPRQLAFARDMFMFGFYMRGMSFVDMAMLKKTDYQDGYISYKRKKTQTALVIKVEECAKKILRRYETPNEYLLPILNSTSEYKSILRLHNKRLHEISKIMGLNFKLTSYVVRHTWASVAKKKGVSIQIISEGMGHTSENTTKIYLDSLDSHVIDDANRYIIND